MQEYTTDEQKQEKIDQAKKWLQDNLRIIVSIVIVAVIAGGIYSYSKRVESPTISDDSTIIEQDSEDSEGSVEVENKDDNSKAEDTKIAQEKGQEQITSQASSKETEVSFIETAGKGDSATRLARRALANYLEKNADSTLTKEHKIFIEDYLRKNVPTQKITIGSSMEFSKDLIQRAIAESKNLNEKQLKNLEKYSARVPSLT